MFCCSDLMWLWKCGDAEGGIWFTRAANPRSSFVVLWRGGGGGAESSWQVVEMSSGVWAVKNSGSPGWTELRGAPVHALSRYTAHPFFAGIMCAPRL